MDMHFDIFLHYYFQCLKESYVKALGIGIGFELQRIDFRINTPVLTPGVLARDTEVHIDGQRAADWTFEETKLDSSHFVAVALQDRSHTYKCDKVGYLES